MSFPRYPTYKPSGVEWLGEVPEHWEITQLKWQTCLNDGGVWGLDPDDESTDTIVLRSTEQTVDGKWQLDEPATRRLSPSEKASSVLTKGDLVITKSSGSSAHIGKTTIVTDEIAELNCCYSNFMQRLRLAPSLNPMLAWHALNNRLFREQFDFLSNSTTGLANLNGTMIGQVLIPLAPRAEQDAIATFLTRETTKIDALIAEQQRLIELLQEKRQAVISHAVTKGLNPDAPMKDSGVEWLGEVPEHWEVTQLRHYSKSIPGLAFPSAQFVEDESQWKLLRGINVGVSCIRWDEVVFWEREDGDQLDQYVLAPGDLVVGLDRPLIKEGLRVARVRPADCPCLLLQRVAAVKGTKELATDYLYYLLSSPFFVAHFEPDTTGVSVPHISTGQIDSFVIPKPPNHEQQQIVSHLSSEIRKIKELSVRSTESISLLQERRSALISAAVTGQIDVRGLVPEAEAA